MLPRNLMNKSMKAKMAFHIFGGHIQYDKIIINPTVMRIDFQEIAPKYYSYNCNAIQLMETIILSMRYFRH